MKEFLLKKVGLLFICTTAVNAGNYGLNLLLGRWLGPSEFSEVSIIAAFVLIISFIALSLQLTAAKYYVVYEASSSKKQFPLNRFLTLRISKIAIGLTLGLLLLTWPIASFLNLQSSLSLAILIIGIPTYLIMSVQRGIQLGKQNVLKLSLSYLVEMVTRVVITVLLVAILCYLELGFYTLAVSIGFLLSFIATHFYIKESYVSSQELSHFTWPKEIIVFIALTGLYEFGQIIINNCDLILVKHFFESKSAGLYASLSLIGRMVFFATWSVVGLLIPHVIEQKQKGKAYNKILIGAVSFVGAIGGGITLSCFLLDEIIIQVAFGEAYLSISPLLWKYALATSFFACANVFAYFYMALDQYIPVVLTIVAGMIQALLIYFNHNSLENVVWMQILAMSGLFIVLNIYHIIQFILNEKIKISHRYSLPTR